MKISLSLSGGGIKGIAHIGAIKALEEENIKVDYVSGTSSGSIVATLYACGYNADEMHEIFNKYAKDFHYIDFENIKKFFKNIFTGKGIVIDGLNSGTKISKLINEVCSKKGIYNINQIKMPLIIPAVNIETEELYVFSNCNFKNKTENVKYINDINIGNAVQASCSFPGVFSPCNYNGKLLVDGGIAENIPWRETKNAGADKVISIVFKDKYQKNVCKNIIQIANHSISVICKELAKYEWDGSDYLLTIETEGVGLLEKKKMQELYYEGYRQTKEYLKNIKIDK